MRTLFLTSRLFHCQVPGDVFYVFCWDGGSGLAHCTVFLVFFGRVEEHPLGGGGLNDLGGRRHELHHVLQFLRGPGNRVFENH